MGSLNTESQLIVEEIQGDTLTPISIYQRLQGKKKFLLESSLKHENSGRFSFIGADPFMELIGYGDKCQMVKKDSQENLQEKPLEVLKQIMSSSTQEAETLFPFIGGAVGYAGYDAIRQYENIGEIPKDEMNVPDVHFLFFEVVVVFDHLEQNVYPRWITTSEWFDERRIRAKIKNVRQQIQQVTPAPAEEEAKLSSFRASMPKQEFIGHVKKAKKYIEEGDIFQVVLSQRLKATIEGDPFSLYRKLRIKNPSPYMYYFDFDEYYIAGVSPESLIKVTGKQVITNPIAGTRPRGKNADEDEILAKDLIEDEKELAEHKMLVDLGRNDLGRVSEFGSVQINKISSN